MSKKTELVLDKYYSIDLELVDNGVIITSWDHTESDIEIEGKAVAQDPNTAKELGNPYDTLSGANIAGFKKVCEAMLQEGVF